MSAIFRILTLAFLSIICSMPGASAQESTNKGRPTSNDSVKARTKELFKAPDGTQGPTAITLEDVRDSGILLRFLRMNIFGIYQEAARTVITNDSPVDLAEAGSIPYKTTGKLLPPRLQWLVFYLGTIEPVIKELKNEVGTEEDALNPVIPQEVSALILPLWKEWSADIGKLNAHLDELFGLFDHAEQSNVQIQAVAVAMNEDIDKLEDVRKRVFKTLQQIQKTAPNSKILVSPPAP